MNATRLLPLLLVICGTAFATAAAAQDEPPTQTSTMEVTVEVKHGATSAPVSDVPVFLRAARPRGPFEPTAPRPESEWSGFTDASGNATFNVPRELMTSGLRLHAASTYGGVVFQSPAATPGPGVELDVTVYEKGIDPSGVAIKSLRTVVDVWEDYLVFTQFYSLTNEGKTALDTGALPGEEFEKGLPIELPVKAQGINASGEGKAVVVNSTVYWNGTLEPQASKNLQVRFSMPAKSEEFVYEQEMAYPTRNIEVVVPVQTRHAKLPRLNDLELRPPGFPESERGAGIWGLRQDIEFVGARGATAEAGESFRFQLRGLPFHRPLLPWIFLGLGLLVAIAIVVYAHAERKRAASARGREAVHGALVAERDEIMDELVALENDYDDGHLTEGEYDLESAALRERLALVLKKIEDLENAK